MKVGNNQMEHCEVTKKNEADLDPLPWEALEDRLLKESKMCRTIYVESMTVD